MLSQRTTGGARRDRTDDLLLAKQALSQLSYGPDPNTATQEMVGLGGLEPPTSRLSSARSNQLSYKPSSLTAQTRYAMAHHSKKKEKRRRRRSANDPDCRVSIGQIVLREDRKPASWNDRLSLERR